MNPRTFRLLFHHHDIAYQSSAGEIWLTSGIGRWISALSTHFHEIGLLLHESHHHLQKQDFKITERNVRLISLGAPGRYLDHFEKLQRVRRACEQAGAQADGLLIRGMTSGQYNVWQHTPVANKAFLLVRSPKQKRLVDLKPATIVSTLVNQYREHTFGRIVADGALLMANSPLHIKELEEIYSRYAHFVPTNTIREAEFAPFQVKPLSNPIRIFYCGRLHILKGVRELLVAVSALRQQGMDCELDLAGALEEPGYTELRRLAGELGSSSHIRWHGHVPFGEQLFHLYRSADVFILPSYTEGFPRVIWEASANCCPVITTSVGGIPALIKHEQHALLIPPKDSGAIVAAVNRLVAESTLRQAIIERAYQNAKGFSVESCAREMTTVLSNEWN